MSFEAEGTHSVDEVSTQALSGLDQARENIVGPGALLRRRNRIKQSQIVTAQDRSKWIARNPYFYNSIKKLFSFLVEPQSRVLNVRCQTGFLLKAVNPSYGVGVELSREMVEVAQKENPEFVYRVGFPEELEVSEKFDSIIFGDVSETVDAYMAFRKLLPACNRHTRLLVYNYNHIWEPILDLAVKLGLKMPQPEQNWLSESDTVGILNLAGFEYLKTYRTVIFPYNIPIFSLVMNRFIAQLPLINRLCMVTVIVARPKIVPVDRSKVSVSVIIPCKNEKGNVEGAVRRIPEMGGHTEIIFCDDQSTDGTADEVRRMQRMFPDRDIRLIDGPGICKSENVWSGFREATGDVLMILDADLTVMPEELPMFFRAIANHDAEFVNGSRLVYPVPSEAMRATNMFGNKVFSVVFSFLLGQRVKDTLCGTKVLWRTDWLKIQKYNNTWGLKDLWGDYELLLGASRLNLKILDLPVHYQERVYGVTKMVRVFGNGLRMLRICMAGFVKLKLGLS